jgi:catalase
MPDQLSSDLVAGFDALFGEHDGFRAAHAKGLCCDATFIATSEAAALTRAPHMQGDPVRATVRFSNGSGDPTAHDNGREPRGMAVKFHLDDKHATDIVSINHSVFIVKTPEEVVEFMRLRRPDPETGKINLEALGAFVAARPGSQQAAQQLLGAPPLASFLTTRYFAIHAFRFVAADGSVRYGRYSWVPDLAVEHLTPEEAKEKPADYLREDLLKRLVDGPARFQLQITLANEEDDPTDPTTEWPDDRQQIMAGTLEVTGPSDDQDTCELFVFDPTRLCDGIESSGDRVLEARSGAYAISSRRRTRARKQA